jgi:hypothetical protein
MLSVGSTLLSQQDVDPGDRRKVRMTETDAHDVQFGSLAHQT